MTNKLRALPAGFLPLALVSAVLAAPAPEPSKEPPRPRGVLQRAVWADLASTDEIKVTRAVLALGRSSRETVAFLKGHLRPVKADAKRVAQWLRELDSESAVTRQQAQEELEYLGGFVEADLKKTLKDARGADLKKRIEAVLSRVPRPVAAARPAPKIGAGGGMAVSIQNINGQVRILINGQPIDINPQAAIPQGPSPYWLRAVRAVAVLESIGTPEARSLIEQVAAGEQHTLPTEQAKAALRRLKEK